MFLSTASRKSLADALNTLFATSKLRLFTPDIVVGPNTVVGNLTEATFGGYAAISITANVEIRDDGTGDWLSIVGAVGSFKADNTISGPQTVHGWSITNTAGTALIAFSNIDPFTFNADGDGMVLDTIKFRLPVDLIGGSL